MKTKFTTWGKWESLRQDLTQTLIEEQISSIETIDSFFLQDVATAMGREMSEYLWCQKQQNKELDKKILIACHRVSLGALVRLLSTAFELSEEQKRQYLMPFVEKANQISEVLAEDLLFFLNRKQEIKNSLIEKYFGKDFLVNYPDLVEGLFIYDSELRIELEKCLNNEMEKIINTKPQLKNILEAELIFQKEIDKQKYIDPNFAINFQKATGHSIRDYKIMEKHGKGVCVVI